MEELIEAIRASVLADATPEARARGVAACRMILTALEAQPGQPMPATAALRPPDPAQIAGLVGALRGMPSDQLLDVAITRLRSALPAGAEVVPVKPLTFHLVPLPKRQP